MQNKRSLSTVVTTLILIALVLVAVAIVWVVVNKIIKDEMSSIESCSKTLNKVTLNNLHTYYDPDSDKLQFSISIRDINVDKVLVTISGGGVKKSFTISNEISAINNLMNYPNGSLGIKLPEKNSNLTYVYDMIGFDGEPDSIQIAAIINGKQCGICDSLYKIDIGEINIEECISEPIETTCGTWVCGTKTNNCGEGVNCPPGCGSGESCVDGICVKGECIHNCSCASDICVGETCSDGCGGSCDGMLEPDCGIRVCGPAPNGCGGSDECGTCTEGICVDGICYILGPSDYDFSLVHDGLTRRYIVHVPNLYDKITKTPIVLAFHGGGGNANSSPEYFGLNNKSDEAGFIVVYPEGTGKEAFGKFFGTWNAGRCCGSALENNIDDVGFIDNMIKQLEKDFNIDAKRIFATGFSNGAQMSYRIACELSDKIAAIAPGGSMGTFEYCDLTRPVPIFAFGGTEDPCTPYGGGEICGGCAADFWNNIGVPVQYETYRCDGVEEHIDKWRNLDNCTEEQEIIYQENNTTCVSYTNCQDGAEIVLCICYGGGHVWPGKDEYSAESCKINPDGFICTAWKNAIGPLIPDFNVNDMIWEFFERHPIK